METCTERQSERLHGREFEEWFLGKSADWRKGYPEHDEFAISLILAKAIHPASRPICPPTEIAKELYNLVAEYLGISAIGLCFYSTVGTSLDYWHGVDCFFELDKAIVTIDLSGARRKKIRADLLITPKIRDQEILKACALHIAESFSIQLGLELKKIDHKARPVF